MVPKFMRGNPMLCKLYVWIHEIDFRIFNKVIPTQKKVAREVVSVQNYLTL